MPHDKVLPTRRHANWNNSHLPSHYSTMGDEPDHPSPEVEAHTESLVSQSRGETIGMRVIAGPSHVKMPARHPRDMSSPSGVSFSPEVAHGQTKVGAYLEPFTCFDCFIGVVSIVTYILDLGSDIWLGVRYYQQKDYFWCAMTLTFPLAASLVMMVTSLVWYHNDFRNEREMRLPKWRWVLRIVFHVLQLGPLMRYIDTIIYGFKSRNQTLRHETRQVFMVMRLYEDADSAMLRMFDCFLESAPQLILQLYIIFTQGHTHEYTKLLFQYGSCILSWISLAWSLTSYHAALRLARVDKDSMNWKSMSIFFMWKLLIIGGRILSLSLFASVFKEMIFIGLTFHVLIMFAWILFQRTSFCDGSCRQVKEVLWNLIVASIYCFEFLNVKEGHTRKKYIAYYTVHYLENVTLMVLWHFRTKTSPCCVWSHWMLLGLALGLFWVGICVMAIYYLVFHPTNKIRCCLGCPCNCNEGSGRNGTPGPNDVVDLPSGTRQRRHQQQRYQYPGERQKYYMAGSKANGDRSSSTRGASSSSSNPVHVGNSSSHSRSVSSPSGERTEGTVSPEFMSCHNGQYSDRYLSYV